MAVDRGEADLSVDGTVVELCFLSRTIGVTDPGSVHEACPAPVVDGVAIFDGPPDVCSADVYCNLKWLDIVLQPVGVVVSGDSLRIVAAGHLELCEQ